MAPHANGIDPSPQSPTTTAKNEQSLAELARGLQSELVFFHRIEGDLKSRNDELEQRVKEVQEREIRLQREREAFREEQERPVTARPSTAPAPPTTSPPLPITAPPTIPLQSSASSFSARPLPPLSEDASPLLHDAQELLRRIHESGVNPQEVGELVGVLADALGGVTRTFVGQAPTTPVMGNPAPFIKVPQPQSHQQQQQKQVQPARPSALSQQSDSPVDQHRGRNDGAGDFSKPARNESAQRQREESRGSVPRVRDPSRGVSSERKAMTTTGPNGKPQGLQAPEVKFKTSAQSLPVPEEKKKPIKEGRLRRVLSSLSGKK